MKRQEERSPLAVLSFEDLVSILVRKEIKLLGKAETEKEYRISPELRGTRLDSVGIDVDHTL